MTMKCKHPNSYILDDKGWVCDDCDATFIPEPPKVPEKFSKNYIWETPKHATTDALEKINEILDYLKEKEDEHL